MQKKPTTPERAAASASAATTNTNDVAAVLLDVLRSVDRQVASTLELSQEALEAVARFRAIAAALNVEPYSYLNGSGLRTSASRVRA